MTQDIDGSGLERPDQIVVTWFENAASKEAFENDPAFQKAGANQGQGGEAGDHYRKVPIWRLIPNYLKKHELTL